jgi:hypothetical protein
MDLTPDQAADARAALSARTVTKDTGCHEWTGCITSGGYGMIRLLKKRILTHRLSYLLNRGKLLPGMIVMHLCDNPPCVNPKHLELGTHTQNMRQAALMGTIGRPTLGEFARPLVYTFRVLDCEKEAWQAKAKEEGFKNLSEWMRHHLNAEVQRVLSGP